MSHLEIHDLESTILDRVTMTGIAGGVDVNIDRVNSTVESADSPSISGDLFGALVTIVIEGIDRERIRRERQRPDRPA